MYTPSTHTSYSTIETLNLIWFDLFLNLIPTLTYCESHFLFIYCLLRNSFIDQIVFFLHQWIAENFQHSIEVYLNWNHLILSIYMHFFALFSFFPIFFVTVASRFSRTLKQWKLSESDENAGERVFDLFQSVSSVPAQLQRHVRGMKRHDRTKKQKEHATRHLIWTQDVVFEKFVRIFSYGDHYLI